MHCLPETRLWGHPEGTPQPVHSPAHHHSSPGKLLGPQLPQL